MDIIKLMEELIDGKPIKIALNLVNELMILADYIVIAFNYMGIGLFMWGFFQWLRLAKQQQGYGGNISAGSIITKQIFGVLLYKSSAFIEVFFQSVWNNTYSSNTSSYLSQSQAQMESNPLAAAMFIAFAIFSAIGLVYFHIGAYQLATIGESQNQHAHFWKAIFIMFLSIVVMNVSELADGLFTAANSDTVFKSNS